ncbi:uncharacterized protein [Drosophila suzukii]|uniref:CCHC-type domain-containing protein n=1 Tax=Drosophila suzukii TaxID=28584 RepID=A0ABM4TY19_DROSZ
MNFYGIPIMKSPLTQLSVAAIIAEQFSSAECRAKKMACYYCGKIGHFSKYCKQQKKRVDNNNYNSSNRRVDNNNISNKRVDNNNYKSKQIDVDRKQAAGAVINWIESE